MNAGSWRGGTLHAPDRRRREASIFAALRSPLRADLRRGLSRGACCSFWSDLAWAPEPAMSPEHPKRSIPLCLSRGLSGVVLGLPVGDIVFGHEVVRRRRQLGCRLAADETAEVWPGQRLRFGVVFRHPGGGSLRSMPARPMSVGIRSTWPVGVVIPSGAGDTPGPFTSSGTRVASSDALHHFCCSPPN